MEESHDECSSQMSLVDEDEFQHEILVTLVFNVRVFLSHVIFTCSFCPKTGHDLGSCPYWSSQMLPSKAILVIPPNITPLPQSSIQVLMSTINTTPIISNIYGLTTNPFSLLVPTQEVVDLY